MPTLKENLKKLDEFKALESNWNDNGADPFDESLIKTCRKILKKLNPQPDVFPTGRDSIQFEYELDNGKYLEFEIYEDKAEVYEEFEDGNKNEAVISHDPVDFIPYIKKFFEK